MALPQACRRARDGSELRRRDGAGTRAHACAVKVEHNRDISSAITRFNKTRIYKLGIMDYK